MIADSAENAAGWETVLSVAIAKAALPQTAEAAVQVAKRNDARARRDALVAIARDIPNPEDYANYLPLEIVNALLYHTAQIGGIYRCAPEWAAALRSYSLVEYGAVPDRVRNGSSPRLAGARRMKRERHNGMDPRSLRLDPGGERFRELAPVDDRPVREAISSEVAEIGERRRVARMLTGTSHMGAPEQHRGRPPTYGAPIGKVRAYAQSDGTCSVCGARVVFGCEHLA